MFFRFSFPFRRFFRFVEVVCDRRWRRGHFVKDVFRGLVGFIGICAEVKIEVSVDGFPVKFQKKV